MQTPCKNLQGQSISAFHDRNIHLFVLLNLLNYPQLTCITQYVVASCFLDIYYPGNTTSALLCQLLTYVLRSPLSSANIGRQHTLNTLTATRHCISSTGGHGPSGSTQPMMASVWCWSSGANMYLYRLRSVSDSPRNASCLMNGKLTVYPTHERHYTSTHVQWPLSVAR